MEDGVGGLVLFLSWDFFLLSGFISLRAVWLSVTSSAVIWMVVSGTCWSPVVSLKLKVILWKQTKNTKMMLKQYIHILIQYSLGLDSTGWQICIGTILGGRCEVMDWFRKKKFYQKKFLRYIAFIVYKKDFL